MRFSREHWRRVGFGVFVMICLLSGALLARTVFKTSFERELSVWTHSELPDPVDQTS